jgi:RNA polymerase sigma-70 factor, ECF subfamily
LSGKDLVPIRIETEWCEKLRNGDENAFKELFVAYCQSLINFACRFVKDVSIAENIVQDVFLKVWMNRSQLDVSLNFKSYIYTAVKNQALKHLKHEDVVRHSSEIIKAERSFVKTPEDEMSESELKNSFYQAIDELPEKCRLIFSLNRFDKFTYAEIADLLDISIKTVETQMGRALKYLRKRLIHFLAILSL